MLVITKSNIIRGQINHDWLLVVFIAFELRASTIFQNTKSFPVESVYLEPLVGGNLP